MKSKLLIISVVLINCTYFGQIVPTAGGQGSNSIEYWSRSGNNQNGSNNNIFGTIWNSPIYTITGGIAATNVRMKLNGDYNIGQYPINGFLAGINTSGYMGLGYNTPTGSGQHLWSNLGPFSQLHLNGRVGAFVQDLGYRPWMQTGVTFTDNQDLSYIGLRQVGTGFDATETVILWSDNAGVDDLTIRFSNGGGNSTINSTNLTTADDLDGLHVARFTGGGNFGLGNTFGINPTGTPANLYVSPQSLAHYSLSNFRSVWQQFTNRNTTLNSGTGENATDGLRIGIVGNSNLNVNGTAAMYNQEDRALLFSTNANTNTMNVLTGSTQERMRIMSAGTPTHLASGGFGVYNPAGVASNLTRMSISHNPAQPITRPMSLLHLGYNTGLTSTPAGATDGWRNWMDIGTFTTNGTDHMYMGLKQEGSSDRQDAVLGWGDNQTTNGPDNMRFIFTSASSGSSPANTVNGLEGMRMTPTTSTGVFTGIGGDPTSNQYGPLGASVNPTATLEVNSWGATGVAGGSSGLRFTNLNTTSPTVVNPGTGVLSVNAVGDVIYVESATGVSLGAACDDAINGKLQFDTKIDLNDHNFYFVNKDITPILNDNRVGVGYNCADALPAKFSTQQKHFEDVSQNTIAGHFTTSDISNSINNNIIFTGVYGEAVGLQPQNYKTMNRGGRFFAKNAQINYGVYGIAEQGDVSYAGIQNIGGAFEGWSGKTSAGVVAQGSSAQQRNIGVSGIGTGPLMPSSIENIGGQFTGAYSAGHNYGVYAGANFGNYAYGIKSFALYGSIGNYGIHASATGTNAWAGWFDGAGFLAAGAWTYSDHNLKHNIQEFQEANSILSQLNPVRYNFKTAEYPQLHLSTSPQIGLLAQELEQVLPDAVRDAKSPAKYDSLGNVIEESVAFKAVSYEKLIPVLVAGHQEQQAKIEELEAKLEEMMRNYQKLEACLMNKFPDLCEVRQGMIQNNTIEKQAEIIHSLNVNLSSKNNIILNQNVPNPFAESTVITYSVPTTITKAQIHFFDGMGNLIQSVDVTERGEGQLNVFGADLSSGVYTYSLVADGKIVDTKRMVKE